MFIVVTDSCPDEMVGYLEAIYYATCKILCKKKTSLHTWAVCSTSVDVIISLPLLSDLIRMDEDHQHPHQTNERNQGGRTESGIYIWDEASTKIRKTKLLIGTYIHCHGYGCVFSIAWKKDRKYNGFETTWLLVLTSGPQIHKLKIFVFLWLLFFYLRNFFQSAFVFVLYAVMKSLAGIWNGKALGNSIQSNLVMTWYVSK